MSLRHGSALKPALLAVVIAGAVWSSAHAKATQAEPAPLSAAEAFSTYCASCHGEDGKGKGNLTAPSNWKEIDAADHSRLPRDFTQDWFRHGDSRTDIELTILLGSRHTAMEGFSRHLTAELASGLADIVLQLRGGVTNADIAARHPERIPQPGPLEQGRSGLRQP